MIFIDANIPMYVVGAPHPHKMGSVRLIEAAVAGGERLVTDAAVLQEILHRYVAIARPAAIQPAFDVLLGVVDEVFPVERTDVESARTILGGIRGLSARDALHVATMRRYGVESIISFDTGFDSVPVSAGSHERIGSWGHRRQPRPHVGLVQYYQVAVCSPPSAWVSDEQCDPGAFA